MSSLPLRHLIIFHVVITHVDFKIHAKKEAVIHIVCTKLMLITVVSHFCIDGPVLIEMYSTVKDIKIIMNMVIIIFYIQKSTVDLHSNDTVLCKL